MGGDGGSRGECQDWTVWKDSMLEETFNSDSAFSESREEGLWCLDGGLVISDRMGGAVVVLLKLCSAWGRDGSF